MKQCLARPESERTPESITDDANVYGHVLFGTVPYERLGDAYYEAMKNHKSNFSLTTVDFISAWDRIKAREASGVKVSDPCLFCETSKNDSSLKHCPFHG